MSKLSLGDIIKALPHYEEIRCGNKLIFKKGEKYPPIYLKIWLDTFVCEFKVKVLNDCYYIIDIIKLELL